LLKIFSYFESAAAMDSWKTRVSILLLAAFCFNLTGMRKVILKASFLDDNDLFAAACCTSIDDEMKESAQRARDNCELLIWMTKG
jgi:hypothetical protein